MMSECTQKKQQQPKSEQKLMIRAYKGQVD